MTINILGTDYIIVYKDDEEICAAMGVEPGYCGGYCSETAKEIAIANLNLCKDTEEEKAALQKANLRHEIVHAFLNESGLSSNANQVECWAKNEEMVDWIAIQGPKIYKVWQKVEAL